LFSFCDSLKIINDMYACIMIAWTLLTKYPGTLCKLGAKTLNALLQLPMAKVCEAWVCAQALCIHGCRTSWVSGIWDSGTAKAQLFYSEIYTFSAPYHFACI
jgi:hypothetical protein